MKLNHFLLFLALLAIATSCTNQTTNHENSAGENDSMQVQSQTLEDSTKHFQERMESSDKKIDTLQNQIDSLLKDI